jgi:hypothetical protein
MTPDQALARQLACYRAMTGEQRLAIALRLHELACDLSRAGIRRQRPDADDAAVEQLLRERLVLGRSS